MAQNISDNIRTAAPKPLDDKWGVFEAFPVGWRPFNNIAEFNSLIPLASRFDTQTFWVRSTTDALKADLYTLDKNKNPYKVQSDVDLSNYYTKAQIDAFNASMQLEIASLQEVTMELNEDLIDLISRIEQNESDIEDLEDTSKKVLTVNTYTEMLSIAVGVAELQIFVIESTQYNDANEFFTYVPTKGIAYLGIDFNYTD